MKETHIDIEEKQRVAAIVGRPNVGKSALFNRIIGRRLSIVHEESGVTRDRLVCEANWHGKRFELIDTGGLELMDAEKADHTIPQSTRDQIFMAIKEAAVVVLVVDIQDGLVAMDKEVQRVLLKSGCDVVVAANKADNPQLDDDTLEFSELGFPVIPVSALHNRGIDEMMKEITRRLPPQTEEERNEILKVAVVGKPNAGKSSYINRLLGSDRVIVSDVPGTTRDSIEVPFTIGAGSQARHYRLIDTAGMRKTGKIHNTVERYSIYRAETSIKQADVVVLMMDAEQGPSSQDKRIAHFIQEQRKGCLVLVNKWDMAQKEKITERKYGEALRQELPFMTHVPVLFISAKEGYKVRRSIDAIDYVAAQVQTVMTTGVLNRILHNAFQKTQPPVVAGKRLKFYYASQAGTKPVRIRLFVNDPKRIKPAYRQYLINTLRSTFGLEGAPVVLQFRSSHEASNK